MSACFRFEVFEILGMVASMAKEKRHPESLHPSFVGERNTVGAFNCDELVEVVLKVKLFAFEIKFLLNLVFWERVFIFQLFIQTVL